VDVLSGSGPCPIPRGTTLVRWTRRAASAVLAVTTLLFGAPMATAAPVTTTEPTLAAAGWLATQLVDGERIETTFGEDTYPDHGLTADVVFALAGGGVAADEIAAAGDWLEAEVDAYTGEAWGDLYAGATAKLLLVAAATHRDPADFGGADLVALLEAQEEEGRYRDRTDGDWSNVITQSLAVLGLHRTAGASPSPEAVTYLVEQACDGGGFPTELDAASCTGNVDATGFAVQALLPLSDSDPDAAAAVEAAVAWLLAEQGEDGSFGGPDSPANANSTGLAAAALAAAGEEDAVDDARGFLRSLQASCGEDEPGSLAFDATTPGDRTRATAQGVLGLVDAGLATVTATGASREVPRFDCDDETEPTVTSESEPADGDPAAPEAVADDDAAGAEEPREGTEAAPGEMPRTGATPGSVALLGVTLLGVGAFAVRRATVR
jgi:hypothetical protein